MEFNHRLARLVPHKLRRLRLSIFEALNTRIRKRHGTKSLTVPVSRTTHALLAWKPSWMTHLLSLLLPMRTGVFLDVGANVGQTLLDLYFADPDRSYFGFEPNSACKAVLDQLIDENGLTHYAVLGSALGQEASVLSLYIRQSATTPGDATVIEDLRPGRKFHRRPIPCFALDSIITTLTEERPAILKIDVEGAELDVLQGTTTLLEKERPFVICEVLFSDKNAGLEFMRNRNDKLIGLLQAAKYEVFRIIKRADHCGVSHLQQVDGFENKYWTMENADQCDYLFVPAELTEKASKVIRCQRSFTVGDSKQWEAVKQEDKCLLTDSAEMRDVREIRA